MPERRNTDRPESSDRRSFPRPPLWLNLTLILLGIAGLVFARFHRENTSERFAHVIERQARTPEDLKAVKHELAEMDLTREALQNELKGRAQMIAGLKSEDFHLAIDTRQNKMRFYYGDTVLRESNLVAGESKTVKSGTRSWTFIPLKGAFPVEAKLVGHHWRIPEWVYAMQDLPVPAERPAVPNGLGKYVIFLPNGYAIHSPPAEASPLKGPKPGSFMVSEEDLAAIWERVHKGKTQVYIF